MNRGRGGGIFQPQTLEVDDKIFDRNLKIVDDDLGLGDSPAGQRFAAGKGHAKALLPEPDLPSVTVCPEYGMCVKTKNVAGDKVFINICKIQAIPPARPITEEKLQAIVRDEDYSSDYRIPMSLGAPRSEKDKSGQDCLACDVAVNSVWYDQTMENSITFTTFLVSLAMEGLCEKYGDACNLDRHNWSILKNKKYLGKLQRHTIQQRANVSKIQEVVPAAAPAAIEEVRTRPPDFVLTKDPATSAGDPDFLRGEFRLPAHVVGPRDVALDLGEDRLVLDVPSASAFLDIFLPFDVDPDSSRASLDRDTGVLLLEMKVKKRL